MSEASQLDSATDHIAQGMFNQHDILKMKRLAAHSWARSSRTRCWKHCWSKAEEEFSYTAERQPHEITVLTTYHYKKHTGQSHDLSSQKPALPPLVQQALDAPQKMPSRSRIRRWLRCVNK